MVGGRKSRVKCVFKRQEDWAETDPLEEVPSLLSSIACNCRLRLFLPEIHTLLLVLQSERDCFKEKKQQKRKTRSSRL